MVGEEEEEVAAAVVTFLLLHVGFGLWGRKRERQASFSGWVGIAFKAKEPKWR